MRRKVRGVPDVGRSGAETFVIGTRSQGAKYCFTSIDVLMLFPSHLQQLCHILHTSSWPPPIDVSETRMCAEDLRGV